MSRTQAHRWNALTWRSSPAHPPLSSRCAASCKGAFTMDYSARSACVHDLVPEDLCINGTECKMLAYRKEPCSYTDGLEDGDMCYQYSTALGLSCPEGFYCPLPIPYDSVMSLGSEELRLQFQDAVCNDSNLDTFDEYQCCSPWSPADSDQSWMACKCRPGLYCPNNTFAPQPCWPGAYCPTPKEAYQCGEGHYCQIGSVEQVPCNGFSSCPAGSRRSTTS